MPVTGKAPDTSQHRRSLNLSLSLSRNLNLSLSPSLSPNPNQSPNPNPNRLPSLTEEVRQETKERTRGQEEQAIPRRRKMAEKKTAVTVQLTDQLQVPLSMRRSAQRRLRYSEPLRRQQRHRRETPE